MALAFHVDLTCAAPGAEVRRSPGARFFDELHIPSLPSVRKGDKQLKQNPVWVSLVRGEQLVQLSFEAWNSGGKL